MTDLRFAAIQVVATYAACNPDWRRVAPALAASVADLERALGEPAPPNETTNRT